MKKLAAIAGAGALLLGMAGPAFGFLFGSDDLEVNSYALVINKTYTKADTGDNYVDGMFSHNGIWTGSAGATSLVGNDVNSTLVAGCDCYDDVTINNGALVYNRTKTKADTGDNYVSGFMSGGWIHTGSAGATSSVQNFVNTTMVGL